MAPDHSNEHTESHTGTRMVTDTMGVPQEPPETQLHKLTLTHMGPLERGTHVASLPHVPTSAAGLHVLPMPAGHHALHSRVCY